MAKHKATIAALALIAMTGGLAPLAGAQNLDMQGTADVQDDLSRPSRGMTQARVESLYGEPQNRTSPIGEPPISRWEYSDFVVFFEYDRVIHAVARR